MSRRETYLLIVSLILITFLLASIYGFGLLHALPPPLASGLAIPLAPLAIIMLFSPLFASTTWFFASLALALLLAAVALVRARPPRLIRLYLASGLFLLLAVPLLLPLVYGQYGLAVEAEEGHQMFWLTQPDDRFASAFKNAQRVHERYGCTYHLLGWSQDEVLYYEAACDGRVWAFDPAVDRMPRAVTALPARVDGTRVLGRDSVNTYPPQPSGFPRDAFNHILTYETALSPGGQWQAAAIKNYYGPRDVVVLSRQTTYAGGYPYAGQTLNEDDSENLTHSLDTRCPLSGNRSCFPFQMEKRLGSLSGNTHGTRGICGT